MENEENKTVKPSIYVGVAEFAKISGLSESAVRKLCIEQRIHNFKISRNYRINCEEALKDLKNMENYHPQQPKQGKDYEKMLEDL